MVGFPCECLCLDEIGSDNCNNCIWIFGADLMQDISAKCKGEMKVEDDKIRLTGVKKRAIAIPVFVKIGLISRLLQGGLKDDPSLGSSSITRA